jgi:hypothetical protein
MPGAPGSPFFWANLGLVRRTTFPTQAPGTGLNPLGERRRKDDGIIAPWPTL